MSGVADAAWGKLKSAREIPEQFARSNGLVYDVLPWFLIGLQSYVGAIRSFDGRCVTFSRGPSGTSAPSGQLSRLVKGTSTYRRNGEHSSESVHLSAFQEFAANRSKGHAQLLLLRRGLIRLGRGCQSQSSFRRDGCM